MNATIEEITYNLVSLVFAPRKHIAGAPAAAEWKPTGSVESQHGYNNEHYALKINVNESRRFNEHEFVQEQFSLLERWIHFQGRHTDKE